MTVSSVGIHLITCLTVYFKANGYTFRLWPSLRAGFISLNYTVNYMSSYTIDNQSVFFFQ